MKIVLGFFASVGTVLAVGLVTLALLLAASPFIVVILAVIYALFVAPFKG